MCTQKRKIAIFASMVLFNASEAGTSADIMSGDRTVYPELFMKTAAQASSPWLEKAGKMPVLPQSP